MPQERLTVSAVALALLAAPASPSGTARSPAATPPERPRESVELPGPPGEATILVANGPELRLALERAVPGDVIALEEGAVFEGPFTLPAKTGSGWITLRTSAADDRLPAPGARVDPSYAPLLPKLQSADGAVIRASPGAHHYRLLGLEVRPRPGRFLFSLIELGFRESSVADLPHHIVVDRCYLHGDARRGTRRGIALNSRHTALVGSYLADFKEVGEDSQAVAGWNGTGPFLIANNYLEAAGENVLFGGADPTIPGLVPSDIEVLGNHLAKPTAWKRDEPGFQGTEWSVKNIFELKNARRVLVSGNLLERNWPHAQNGFAVLFTVRNQEGSAPWSVVEDVAFVNNVVRGVAAAINVLGTDDVRRSGRTRRLLVRNNLFEDVGGERWGGSGRLLQLLDGVADFAFEHNTALHTGNTVTADGDPHPRFVFRDNIVMHNDYGLIGGGTAPGLATLGAYFPRASVERNVFVGAPADLLPASNFFPASLDEVGFRDWRAGDYRLAPVSPYRGGASDGSDIGADVAALGVLPGLPEVERPRPPPVFDASGAPAAEWTLWAGAALLGYTYLGYPALVTLLGRLRSDRTRPRAAAFRHFGSVPSVSVVVVARDEASRIGARIENLLDLDYPRDRLELLIGSDGSRDATVAEAERHAAQDVRIVAFPNPRGKPACLNDLVPRARGSIVVLADARQRFERGALAALVAPFRDPRVGAVSGELMLTDPGSSSSVGEGVGAYWRFEKAIRRGESRLDSVVGATGAIYAIRKALFEPLPADTLLDDVLVPLRIARRGYRVRFEPDARAFDRVTANPREELRRKVRTLAGNFQLLARHPSWLTPFGHRLFFQILSHKASRLLTPFALAAVLGASTVLAWGAGSRAPLYQALLAGQAAFYAAALLAGPLRRAGVRSPLLSVSAVVCLLSWATLVALVRFATGRQEVTWGKAAG